MRPFAVALLVALIACGGDEGRRRTSSDADTISDAAYTVRPGTTPYRAIAITEFGRIEGIVQLESSARDTMVAPGRDTEYCGVNEREGAIVETAGGLRNVVVWLADAREGKPLPVSRRFEVTNERCRIDPRVQGVIVGGTLNVKSADPIVHETVIRVTGAAEPMELVTQNGEGQVVPLEHVLRQPVRLELTCRVHPWTQGWIHVFDHPYFAVSAPNGSFAMDSVPPGDYLVRTWHERLGVTSRDVRVTAGSAVRVEVKY